MQTGLVKPYVDFSTLDFVGVVVEPPRVDPREALLAPPLPTVTVDHHRDGDGDRHCHGFSAGVIHADVLVQLDADGEAEPVADRNADDKGEPEADRDTERHADTAETERDADRFDHAHAHRIGVPMAEIPRAALIVVLVLFACVVDAVLFDPLNLPGSPPNVLVLVVAAIALVLGPVGGAVTGFLAGSRARTSCRRPTT